MDEQWLRDLVRPARPVPALSSAVLRRLKSHSGWSSIPLVLAGWFALTVTGCAAEGSKGWQAAGERVRHVTYEIADVLPHRIESSEFLLHGTERAAANEVSVTQRIVLTTDLIDWEGHVLGYEERSYANGSRVLYLLDGTARRWTSRDNVTVTRFELTAYPRPLSLPRSQTKRPLPSRTVTFWMQVYEETGATKMGPR